MRPALRKPVCLIGLSLLFSCGEPGETTLVPTGRVGRALAEIGGVSAAAELVPRGGAPLEAVPLARGDDGLSFSGFLPAEPGDYRLEVVFRGRPEGAPGPVFLGRWTSDAFTVEAGATATPVFRRPIDPIGRPEDEGDLDGDGLGLLDEYLWDADPDASDADRDGRLDGADCTPGDAADDAEIAPRGTIEDCDGDGFLRPDIPYRPAAGTDCDDKDAAINPGATDDCADAIDSDCNPATCPVDDRSAPTFGAAQPAPMSNVGCHQEIEVEVLDDGRLAAVELDASALAQGTGAMPLIGTATSGAWRFPSANVLAQRVGGALNEGRQTLRVRAEDAAGNEAELGLAYTFRFARPEVTALSPPRVGRRDAPFEVRVSAAASLGLNEIALFAAPGDGTGTYLLNQRRAFGTSASSPAAFTVDPARLPEGRWLLYPVVTDEAGNRLEPFARALPLPDAQMELETRADFACLGGPMDDRLPVRVLSVDRSGAASDVSWGAVLAETLAAAAAEDPELELVGITGFGIDPTGRVDLSDATSFVKRWFFGFRHPGTDRTFSVTWATPSVPGENPRLDPRGSGVVQETPLPDPATLPDSPDVLAAHAQQSACPALTGDEDDSVLYQVVSGELRVVVSGADGGTWGASVDPGGTLVERFDCN